MFTNLKKVAAAGALLAATFAAPLCGAQTPTVNIEVLTAGSSAQWGVFAKAAEALANAEIVGTTGATVHHCTINGPELIDNRGGSVPAESGKIWIVWTENAATPTVEDVWAYLSVDSVVGVRAFMAAPRDTLSIASGTVPCGNLLSSPSAGVFTEVDDTDLETHVQTALTGAALTAANTDVRPEDGLYATNRALATLDTTSWNGLGITVNGTISDTNMAAHAVKFALSGTDPISGSEVGSFETLPIGAAPIVFFVNDSLTTTGHLGSTAVTNINNGLEGTSTNDALAIFSGADCKTTELGAVATTPALGIQAILREPTSGTMNTAEFTNFRLTDNSFTGSQEENATYPGMTNLQCTGPAGTVGTRTRAVGTGNEVSAVRGTGDTLGYAFYSVEAIPNGSVSAPTVVLPYKYLTLNGHDPLAPAPTTAGEFPVCGSNTAYFCTVTVSDSPISHFEAFDQFDSLRTGEYDSWSVYRAVVTPGTTNATNMHKLVEVAQAVVDVALPDFVPLVPACNGTTLTASDLGLPTGSSLSFTDPNHPTNPPVTTYAADEPGLEVFRSHFNQPGATATLKNGAILGSNKTCTGSHKSFTWNAAFVGDDSFASGQAEVGSDVGGQILPDPFVANTTPTPTTINTTGGRQ